MPRARRKPAEPVMPVQWVGTAAQMAGCEVREVREPGKAVQLRRHRLTMVERLWIEGRLSDAQRDAGLRIADLWLRTQLRSSADGERVDRTPRPDAATLALVEAQDRYAQAMRLLPRGVAEVVRHVCCEDRALRDGLARNGAEAAAFLQSLQIGLDLLHARA